MRKRRRLLAVGAIFLVAAATAIVIHLALNGHSTALSAKKPTDRIVAVHASVMPESNVQLLEHGLESSNVQVQAAVLTPAVRGDYLKVNQQIFPNGSTVTVEPKTFKSVGNAAIVMASTSFGKTFLLRLTRQSGGMWLIDYVLEVQ